VKLVKLSDRTLGVAYAALLTMLIACDSEEAESHPGMREVTQTAADELRAVMQSAGIVLPERMEGMDANGLQ
jgi:ketopantoate reductase